MKLCFIDTETTSLDSVTGAVWEVALILRNITSEEFNEDDDHDTEYLWQLPLEPIEMQTADPNSLRINSFYDRRWPPVKFVEGGSDLPSYPMDKTGVQKIILGNSRDPGYLYQVPAHRMTEWAEHFVQLTRSAHLVGNVISFDEERLRKLIRRHAQVPMWHYHLVDVEALIAGRFGIEPPWRSKDLSELVSVPVPEDQHGALPDARWARDMYDAVFAAGLRDEGRYAEARREMYAANNKT